SQADDELLAEVALTQALLAQKKLTDATAEVERKRSMAASSHNLLAQLQFALVSAQTTLATDHPKTSRSQLQTILKKARTRGYIGLVFEARISLAELEKRSGQYAAAKTELELVEKDARQMGL